MGIYDRDYYRRDGPSVLGTFLERGVVCKWLIGINIVMFVLQMLTRDQIPNGPFLNGRFTDALDLNINEVLHGQVWRLLTYAFLHSTGTPFHILFNMLFLWWFGTDVEEIYGPREFLGIYLLAATAGGLLFVVSMTLAGLPGSAIGASGAVTGVLVLCAIHFPSRIIYVMFVLPVPIWLFVIGSVALDAYTMLSHARTGVAVACHLGGAAFAFTYYKLGVRITSLLPSWSSWNKRRGSPRLRVYREDEDGTQNKSQPVSVAAPIHAPASSLDDEQLEAKMDAVLEKISRVGKENLNDSDREVLQRASEKLKKRRN